MPLHRGMVTFALAVIGCGSRSELLVEPTERVSVVAPKPSDAGGDAPHACEAAPRVPTEITSLDAYLREPQALAVIGEHVYLGVAFQGGNPVIGAVFRAPRRGGEAAAVVEGFYGGPLAHDDAHLYYMRYGVPLPGALAPLAVDAYDSASGRVVALPAVANDAGAPLLVLDLVSAGALGAFWIRGPLGGGGAELVSWNGRALRTVASRPHWVYGLAVGSEDAFLLGSRQLERVPLAGGAVTRLDVALSQEAALVGARGHTVYLSPDPSAIVAVNADDGTVAPLVSRANMVRCGYCRSIPAHVDDAWLYYSDRQSESAASLMRVPLAGGVAERVWTAAPLGALAITSDACSVYWVTLDVGASFRIRVMALRK